MGQANKQTHPSLSRWRKVGMCCLWVALTPVLLFCFTVFLLYLPPVQQWAVNTACETLSEDMGMDVKVENVRLSFPLNLRMEGMTAVQDGDTVASATLLNVSVKLLPLFKGQAEVDDASLYCTRLNTKQLIDACEIKGFIEKISLDSHSTDLARQYAIINNVLVSDADLCIVLKDSVPEDTTESEPLLWNVQIDDIQLQRIKASVVLPDSSQYGAFLSSVNAKALLDLGKSAYKAELAAKDIDVFSSLFSAPRITGLSALVEMDSLVLDLKSLKAKTASSELALAYRMDMNAFDEINPGKISAMAEGSIGKADIRQYADIDLLPELPTQFSIRAGGNLNEMNVSNLHAIVPGLLTLDGDAILWNAAKDLSLQANLTAQLAGNAEVKARAEMAMADESYSASISLDNINVHKLVKMPEQTLLNGTVVAHGHGFDFQSAASECFAKVALGKSRYGKIDLSNIKADAALSGNCIDLDMTCRNKQISTTFTFDGELTRQHVGGLLDIDVDSVDLCAMGFMEKPFKLKTNGTFDFDYDLGHVFRIETSVEPTTLMLEKGEFTTRPFYLMADSRRDSATICFQAGDLDLDFSTPNNLFALLPQYDKLIRAAARQAQDKDFNINVLKTYMPNTHFRLRAEDGNPLAQFLKMQGISFQELVADINTSAAVGIDAHGYVDGFCTDSISLDHAEFNIAQDSTVLGYRLLAMRTATHPLPDFYASLEGYLGMKDADAHLVYHDLDGNKGFDIGLHAEGTDSCHHITLYPAQPTLAFQKFDMNGDNFICLPRGGKPIVADVRLQSLADEAFVVLTADANKHGRQEATAIFTDIDVEKLFAGLPLPNVPKMAGLFSGNATYSDAEGGFTVGGRARVRKFIYEGMDVGQVGCRFAYTPQGETAHEVKFSLACDSIQVGDLLGVYDTAGNGSIDAKANIYNVPLEMVSPFIPDQIAQLKGSLTGRLDIAGSMSQLMLNGVLAPRDVHVMSNQYSVDLTLANDTIRIDDSRLTFDRYRIYGYDDNPLSLNGYVDFSDMEKMPLSLSLTGSSFKLVESKRAPKKVLFGNLYGDVSTRVSGSLHDLAIRGQVRVLKSSDMTYIMSETPLSQGDRLDDIVTFVDFRAPADTTAVEEQKSFMGLNMSMNLVVEDGAKVRAELSPDRQSYVDVQGGGTLRMTLTPEGVMSMNGRYTINEGEMKYTLPVIPLRTFTIQSGSYIEFTGDMANPTLSVTATERTRAAVSEADGSSRSVTFDSGVRLSNTLDNMGLEFIITAPDDQTVQNELESLGAEERNKLAVAMLATNMYLAAGNGKNLTASNALNTFLQSEINNIAGKAFSSLVNVDVGMEQTTRDNGTTRTDYSFKFSRRFFSDRLNVIIGGKVNADGDRETGESGTYIDDISLEWRLDDGGSQYVRIFHEKDYTNLIEGDLDQNGAGVLLRKKVEKLSDLFFWRRKEDEKRAK